MAYLFGQLDLTKLSDIAKKQPSLVKKVTFKDGREHKLLNIGIVDLRSDNHGYNKAVRANCKQDEQIDGLNYFIGSLKEADSNYTRQQPQDQNMPSQAPANQEDDNDLPF